MGDPVVLTNTSTAENALIAICKWELGKGVVSYETTPENISYDQAGEYVIKLTVTSDRGAKKSSFEKTIRVVDNNIRPVADFTWSPEKVVAGEPVQFTDRSTDEDGEVVAWEWKFGTTTSDKQNPEFTFAAQGATEVSLTVTDNKKGRNTKTVTIDVGRGAISLDLLWSYPYDDTKDAYVFGTSPAVSPDGEYVYVTSTGYSLVCFTKAGERLWAFDIGKDGASAENNSGSIKVQSPTPSVDEDGTVYAGTQKTGSVAAHVTAISAQGVKRWEHAADGDINGVPAVDDQGFVYYNDRTTGKLVKLRPEDGSRVAEIKLADELRSSPTISYDGTIYVNGMKDDKPTVFAVKGAAEGCAASWSQQGGNPSKTEYMY